MVLSITSVLMAPVSPTFKTAEPRGGVLRPTKSFPRHDVSEDNDPLAQPKRSNTVQNGALPEISVTQNQSPRAAQPDTFESQGIEDPLDPRRASVDMADIPIELVSMTDK
jgi:hypothetical protein